MSQNENTIKLVSILDASGSMSSLSKSVIDSFNVYIEDQAKERGDATLTLSTFNSEGNLQIPIQDVDVKQVNKIGQKEYYIGGMTAMYDAIIDTISNIKGEKVFVVIQTDGHENDSSASAQEVHKLITEKKALGWKFLFLATDINVKDAAKKIALEDSFIEFNKNSKGLEMAFGEMSRGASNYRASFDTTMLKPSNYK